MKRDIRTIALLVVILFTGATLYYTTQSRLDDIDREILFLNRQLGDLQKDHKRLHRAFFRHKRNHQDSAFK